ncbi:MAG: hypothetical protein PHH06_02695, partial [Candidatus Gracilibacteria bacterium]|nr:hypothetical protein [Candidatus Gracilibacteria bacterium]
LKENKFDLASKEITLLNNNYLDQFYEFLDSSKSGPIGNGTIELFYLFYGFLPLFLLQSGGSRGV